MVHEILSHRTENGKTYDLGNGNRRFEAHIGAIHYKNDYATDKDWLDIDLTWEGNRIAKAPYELTRDDKKFTFKNKKTGEASTLELTSVKPAGLKYEVIPELSAVHFRHILSSDKIPFEAQFKITGKVPNARAFDDEGELELESSFKDSVLTEKLSQVKDKDTGKVRPAKGNIRVDPFWQVSAGTDDCRRRYDADGFSTTGGFMAGYYSADYKDFGSAARFLSINIPPGSIITLAELQLISNWDGALGVVNTRIRAQANVTPATFSTAADFDARVWTASFINWDNIPGWAPIGSMWASPDFDVCVQEVINLPFWVSGNPIVILWDDFQKRSTQAVDRIRRAFDYDESVAEAPVLQIEFTPPPPVTEERTAFMAGKMMAAGLI